VRRALAAVTLDDKYPLDHGRAVRRGVQALVKLPMLQRQRDALVGKNTAGFISGYRGSPLGGYDQALWKARAHLQAQHIVFQGVFVIERDGVERAAHVLGQGGVHVCLLWL
jgi:indolepyruvate ferredoxin oxidoreductase